MTTALAALGGSALGAFSNQGRSPAASRLPRTDTSTLAIAGAKDRKTARLAKRNADAERMLELLTDPQIMGLLTVFGGLYAAQHIPWSGDPGRRSAIAGVAAASAVLMGLGRAGVGDMTTLAVAGGAGLASAGGEGIGSVLSAEIAGTDVPAYALTPAGGVYYGLRTLYRKIRH